LFFLTSKPRGPAAFSISEIISSAEHLDVNRVSLLTSPWLSKNTTSLNHDNNQIACATESKKKRKE